MTAGADTAEATIARLPAAAARMAAEEILLMSDLEFRQPSLFRVWPGS